LVIGNEEQENNSVSVRTRDGTLHGTMPLQQLLDELKIKMNNFE
jgi:threonyl-tRNA synthetase